MNRPWMHVTGVPESYAQNPACKHFTVSVEAIGISSIFNSLICSSSDEASALSRGHPAYLMKEGKLCRFKGYCDESLLKKH